MPCIGRLRGVRVKRGGRTTIMEKPTFVCDLLAVNAAERPRYKELVKRVREAMHQREEISGGYRFGLDGAAVTLIETAEWMNMERLCCPFLTLQLSASGNSADWVLTLTGAEGIKPLLDAEFPNC
jgi:hypothetical protein